MRKGIKFIIVLVSMLIMVTAVNVKAAVGFTYDHRGDPIYSTVGLTIHQKPYTANELGVAFEDFAKPEDIFVFTDDEGEKTIYIVDSNSNKLFVFDEDFKLKETVSTFTLNVDNFTPAQLKEIKSGGQYVIARERLLSILQSMEYVNLVYNEETQGEIEISYQLAELDFEYEIRWTTSLSSVAEVVMKDDKPFIVARGEGKAIVTGKLYDVKDLIDNEGKPISDPVSKETVQINVTVTETEEQPELPDKHFGFSIEELEAKGTINFHLFGVVNVYRAVTPTYDEDLIYFADRGNNQVVVVDSETYEVVRIVTAPKSDLLLAEREFSPTDIVTDRAGRIYVIASNVNEGIMQFSREGIFNRFTGVNYVTLSPWEVFWRNFSTEAQLSKQQSIINTSFTSMTVDKEGFIYATSYAIRNDDNVVTNDNNMIKRINPTGKDVLRRNGYQPPKGDVEYVLGNPQPLYNGPSKFRAITVNDYGVYTVVDTKMGRLFTYDNEGNLLYVSGNSRYADSSSENDQLTVLGEPLSIVYLNENVIVLDATTKSLIVYEPSDIGKLINEAVKLEYEGDLSGAALYWEQVVRKNANYEYGYIGIGRMYLNNGDYEKAMEYFKIGHDRLLYSRAYKLSRDIAIRKNFTPVAIIVFVLGAGLYTYKKVKHRHDPKEEETGMGDE